MVLYVAFGDIRRDFPGVAPATLSWILSGYTIVVAAAMLGAGRWSDRLGRRRVFLWAVGVFTLASALCAAAPGAATLVGARVLQGLGAAALSPASLALILRAFPPRRVSQAVAIWGSAGALAAVLGPTIGGLFIEAWGWRSVFIANLPIGLLILALGPRLLDESKEPGGMPAPDAVGAVIVTLSLVLLALAVVESGTWGWTDARTGAALAAGFLLFGLFLVRCARVASPVLDLRLFREPGFRWANLGQVVYATGFTTMFFGNVQFLGDAWGYSPVEVGLAMAPGPLTVFLLAPRVGRIAGRTGPRQILIAGGFVYAAAVSLLIARAGATPSYLGVWLPFIVLSGVGVAMMFPLLTSAAVAALPPTQLATGSAVNASLRAFGQTLGVAIAVAIAGGAAPDELLARQQSMWWLAVASGLAVSAIASRLPRGAGAGARTIAPAPLPEGPQVPAAAAVRAAAAEEP